jgi:hypothetical protein
MYFLKSMCATKIEVYRSRQTLFTPAIAGLILSAVLFTTRVSAILLPPGGLVPATPGPGGGGAFVASTTENFSSAALNGSVTSTVTQNDPANPFGGGFLTFTYVITMNGSPDALSGFSVDSYGGFLTDATFNPANGGVPPTQIIRSSGTGDTITFQWLTGGGLGPNSTSALLVVETDATAFHVTTGGVIDSTPADLNNLLAPLNMPTAVPDATGTATLLAVGLGALFFVRRFQFKPAVAAN